MSLLNSDTTEMSRGMATADGGMVDSCRNGGKMKWDITITDKLLYLVNSIILLVCAILLMLAVKPIKDPTKSVACIVPSQFSTSQTAHAYRTCSSDAAKLVEDSDLVSTIDQDLFENNATAIKDIFPSKSSGVQTDFSTSLYVMAMLSLSPIFCWRLFGLMDGRDFVTENGQNRTASLALWFLITKVGATILCTYFVVQIFVLRNQSDQYMSVLDYNQQPESVNVLCQYEVRTSGGNSQRYVFQCDMSKSTDIDIGYEYLLPSVIKSLQLWLVFMVTIFGLNLLVTIVLFIRCSVKSTRLDFIQRYTSCSVGKSACNKMGERLGTTGVIVLTLASKLGQGDKVRDQLLSLCEKNVN